MPGRNGDTDEMDSGAPSHSLATPRTVVERIKYVPHSKPYQPDLHSHTHPPAPTHWPWPEQVRPPESHDGAAVGVGVPVGDIVGDPAEQVNRIL